MTNLDTASTGASTDTPAAPFLDDDAPHLLIIDDDRRIRSLLSRFLSERGFRVSMAADAAEARKILKGLDFDLLVVDVMMPGESGLDLVRSFSAVRDTPILMLTARSDTEQRIEGLEAGADDYLPKPFDPRELLLRINNILKRGAPPTIVKVENVRFGPFTFSLTRKELKRGVELIRLTEREQEIMAQFALKAGETIQRQELLGDEAEVGERTVDVQINRLRRKIESDPANPLWLQTVRGLATGSTWIDGPAPMTLLERLRTTVPKRFPRTLAETKRWLRPKADTELPKIHPWQGPLRHVPAAGLPGTCPRGSTPAR